MLQHSHNEPSTSNTSNGACLLCRSLINRFITVLDNQMGLFYFILGYSKNSALVKIEKDGMVEDLHNGELKVSLLSILA